MLLRILQVFALLTLSWPGTAQSPGSDSRLRFSGGSASQDEKGRKDEAQAKVARRAASDVKAEGKFGPGVREAARTEETVRVFVVLRNQPQSQIAEEVRGVHDLRLQIAEGRYKESAERASFSAEDLEAAHRRVDEVVVEMRRQTFEEIERQINPDLDMIEARIRDLGGTDVLRFSLITMISATVPVAALESIAAEESVERIELVRNAEPQIFGSVPATGVVGSFWAGGLRGSGQWVAVLDSGVRSNHPAFSGRLFFRPPTASGPCFFGDSATNPDDFDGHGTHVAGIAAGGGSVLWSTYVGMAPQAQILNMKVGCVQANQKVVYPEDSITAGVQSVLSSGAARILNLSLGVARDVEDSLLAQAMDRAAVDFNALLVFAGGNVEDDNPLTQYIASPAVAYNGIAVANARESSPGVFGAIYSQSSIGPTITRRRSKPDLAAPGTSIWSANANWDVLFQYDYVSETGTSMAAPHVAGAAALLRQRGVTDSRAIKAILLNSADFPASGDWHPAAGWGYMNLTRAYNQSTQRHFFLGTLTPSSGSTPYRLYRGSDSTEVSATAVWNRYFDQSTPRVSDLDLSLYAQSTGGLLDRSDSRVDNVEQIFRNLGGDFVVKVRSISQTRAAEEYAIAFNSSSFQLAQGPRLDVTCTGPAAPGLNIDFTVNCSISNSGDLTAFNVQATLNYEGQTGGSTVSFGSIAPGGSASRSWTTRVLAAGSFRLVAAAASNSFEESFVGSGAFAFNVAGSACTVSPVLSTNNFGNQGGSATLTVTTSNPSCSWSISNVPSWVALTRTSGVGSGTVGVNVVSNPAAASRSASIVVGSTQVSITQNGTGTGPGGQTTGLRFVPVPPCRLMETRSLYAGTTWTGAFGPPRLQAGQTRTLPIAGAARCGIPATAKAFVLNVTADTVEESTGPVDIVTIYPAGEARPQFGTIRTSTGGYIANSAIVKSGANGAVDIYSSNAVHLLIDVGGYFTDDLAAPGLLFYPFGPCRAVDTRGAVYSQLPAPYGNSRMQSRETRALRLPGSTGCPGLPAAAAYSLQMTLAPGTETNGSPVAYVTAWPNGQAQPIISNMNAYFGYAVSNSGVVPASANGTINVFAFDATNTILDVNGYFAPDDGTGRGLFYYPVSQCRAVDTQDGTIGGGYGSPQLTPAADRVLAIAGSPRCQALPSTAKAWALNATAIPNGVGLPFLSMWPADAPWPVVSQLNAFQGQTVSNSGIVPAGPNGAIQVKVNALTHAIIEVAGYFSR